MTKATKKNPLEKLLDIRDDLRRRVRGQEQQIDGYLATALAGEGMLLLGLRGEAKTALAEAFAAYIDGGQHGTFQLSKGDTPDALFGPPDPSKLIAKDPTFERMDGYLPTCTSVVLDEFGKWNPVCRSALLRVQSERQFEGKALPLRFWLGVSNELIPELRGQVNGETAELGPFEESELPFWDRFTHMMFAAPLDPASNDWDDVVFNDCFDAEQAAHLTLDELDKLQAKAKQVTIPVQVMEALKKLATMLSAGQGSQRVHVSTRKWRKAVNLLRAHALLDGRMEAKRADLRWLEHCLWTTPDQRATLREAIASCGSPETAEALAIESSVAEYMVAISQCRLYSNSGGKPSVLPPDNSMSPHEQAQHEDSFCEWLALQLDELDELAKCEEPDEPLRVREYVAIQHETVLGMMQKRLSRRRR